MVFAPCTLDQARDDNNSIVSGITQRKESRLARVVICLAISCRPKSFRPERNCEADSALIIRTAQGERKMYVFPTNYCYLEIAFNFFFHTGILLPATFVEFITC